MARRSSYWNVAQRRSRWALLAVGLPAGALLLQPLSTEAQTGVKWFGKKPAVTAQPELPPNGFAVTVRRLMDQARAQAAAGQYDAAVQTAERARKIADASSTVLGTGPDVSVAAADTLCQQLILLRDSQNPKNQVDPSLSRPTTASVRPPAAPSLPAIPERPTVVQAIETVPVAPGRTVVSPESTQSETLTLEELARAPLPPVKTREIPFQPSPIPEVKSVEIALDHPGELAPEEHVTEIHTPVIKTPLTPAMEHVEARSAYPPIRPRRDLPTARQASSLSAGAPLKTGVPLSAGTSVFPHLEEQTVSRESGAPPLPDQLLDTNETPAESELIVELGEPVPQEPVTEVVEPPADRMIAEIIATPASITERPTTAPVKVILGRSRPLRSPLDSSFAEESTAAERTQGSVIANQPAAEPAPTPRITTVTQLAADPTLLTSEPVQPSNPNPQGTPQRPATLTGDWSGKSAAVSHHQATLDDGWSRLGKSPALSTPTAGDTHEHVAPVGFEQVLPINKPTHSTGQPSSPLLMQSEGLEFGRESTDDLVHRPNVWLRESSSPPIQPTETTAVAVSYGDWIQAQLQRTGWKWLTPKAAIAGLGVLCITLGMFCVGWATRRSS